MKKTILALALSITLGVTAQNVVKTTADKFNGYGIVYSLPSTNINLKVTLTRSVEKPGIFYKYAQKYLGKAPAVTQERTVWKIKNITATPVGVPDPDKQYAIQLKAGNNVAFYLDRQGILCGINDTLCCHENKGKKEKRKVKSPRYTDADYAQLYTEEMMLMGSTSKMAEAAAKQIYSLREYRLDLLTGNADAIPTEKSFRILLDEMDQREAMLTDLFMGTIETQTVVKYICVTPDISNEKQNSNIVAFRISERSGIVAADDLSGEPVYISIETTEKGEAPTNKKGEPIVPEKGSLVYTIPGYANVKITFKGQSLFSQNLPISQLGVEYGLPASFLTGKEQVKALFCPATGALMSISTETPAK